MKSGYLNFDDKAFASINKNLLFQIISGNLTKHELKTVLLILLFSSDTKYFAELSKSDISSYCCMDKKYVIKAVNALSDKKIIIQKKQNNKKKKYALWCNKVGVILSENGCQNAPCQKSNSGCQNTTYNKDTKNNNIESSLSFFNKLLSVYPKGNNKSKFPFIKQAIENAHLTEQDETKILRDIERRKESGYFDNIYAKNLERYLTDKEWETKENLTFEEKLKLLNS